MKIKKAVIAAKQKFREEQQMDHLMVTDGGAVIRTFDKDTRYKDQNVHHHEYQEPGMIETLNIRI